MRAAIIVIITALASSAYAGDPAEGWGGFVFGKLTEHTKSDEFNASPADYSGWVTGFAARGAALLNPSPYSYGIGAYLEGELYFVSPGIAQRSDGMPAMDAPSAFLAYPFLGIAGGLDLPLVRQRWGGIDIDPGVVLNTDFFGASGEISPRYNVSPGVTIIAGYRVRSGVGWDGTRVLDERTRVGVRISGSAYLGFEYTHGYDEDGGSRADLERVFKGGYKMTNVVLSVTK